MSGGNPPGLFKAMRYPSDPNMQHLTKDSPLGDHHATEDDDVLNASAGGIPALRQEVRQHVYGGLGMPKVNHVIAKLHQQVHLQKFPCAS